jgi:hypothetical protein
MTSLQQINHNLSFEAQALTTFSRNIFDLFSPLLKADIIRKSQQPFPENKMFTKKILLFCLFIGIIGIASICLQIWITPYGPGVSPDSTV